MCLSECRSSEAQRVDKSLYCHALDTSGVSVLFCNSAMPSHGGFGWFNWV